MRSLWFRGIYLKKRSLSLIKNINTVPVSLVCNFIPTQHYLKATSQHYWLTATICLVLQSKFHMWCCCITGCYAKAYTRLPHSLCENSLWLQNKNNKDSQWQNSINNILSTYVQSHTVPGFHEFYVKVSTSMNLHSSFWLQKRCPSWHQWTWSNAWDKDNN